MWSAEGSAERLAARMGLAGISGGTVISPPPGSFRRSPAAMGTGARLDALFAVAGSQPRLFPFYWIDPIEEDALIQVASAVERGARGFKIICSAFFPRDERAMAVYRAIAEAGRPIMFHSGILWDGTDSARFNRPGEFECLLGIDGLRFSLAHISWPWSDECIAVFGKFHAARRQGSAEMFIDLTPGTPPICRRDALTRLFTVGYPVGERLFFGTDNDAADYDADWARQWIDRDRGILGELGLAQGTIEGVFSRNLERFAGAN